MLKPLLDRWRLCALLVSVAMLAIAHGFEHFGGLAPCLLCLKQREVYWAAMGLAAVFMVIVRLPDGPRWREATCWVLGAVFLTGAGLATYHAGVEWKLWPGPTACAGTGGVDAKSLAAFVSGKAVRAVSCEDAAWVFAGLSMAGWNALISVGLAALSAIAAVRERAKQ
jgi:disulfide bond formation protein DsbB